MQRKTQPGRDFRPIGVSLEVARKRRVFVNSLQVGPKPSLQKNQRRVFQVVLQALNQRDTNHAVDDAVVE